LRIEVIDWSEIDWIPKRYSKGFASFSKHKKKHFWLAAFLGDEGSEVMGVGKVLFVSNDLARHCSLFTIPMYRKMGVGRKIIHMREKIAREHGCSRIDVIADISLQYWVRYGYIQKEYKGNKQWRFEKELK
jgi:GNAT superfamily N-acetyltransferase